MLRSFFLAAMLLLACVTALAAPMPTPTPVKPMRVLFVGNSLSYVHNLPATFAALYQAFHAGDLAEAQELQFRANRVIKALLSVPLIAGLKVILSSWGYDCGGPRRPQRPITAEERALLLDAVAAAGLEQLEADARERLALPVAAV